jgi:hypothetical protein
MRLAETHVPIDFRADFPLLPVQPVPCRAYDDATLNNYEPVPDLKQFTPGDCGDYYDTVVRPHTRRSGHGASEPPRARGVPSKETEIPTADKLMVWTCCLAYS